MSTREIARTVGISNGSAYYVLKSLIEKGFVKMQNFSAASDKTKYSYILTAEGARRKLTLTVRFLQRKREEYEALAAEIATMEAQLEERHPEIEFREASDDA